MSCRVSPSSSSIRLSTTAWVAMPAWSVPGIHSASNPCIRFQRVIRSWSVPLSACPMCNAPVTLGRGIMIVCWDRCGFGSASK